ncbi:MAG: FliM/FliN family flagellar motor switch protein [Candidatus Saganbacteria bacterium]|nr:FliM/FliN family flagellar motor switch protein [Candidatus Saganbacteria bacterium]
MGLDRQSGKPEIAAQKRVIKLAPAIGDWTTYKPPKVLVKKIKTGLYGFDRLSREELDQALLLHYRFVQDLLRRFRIDLGMAVELFSVQVEQTTYLNFLRSLGGTQVQCKLKVSGLHEPIFLFMELSLANSVINFSLGSIDVAQINRALTEAEKITLETTLNEYLPAFSSAFSNTIEQVSLSVISSPDAIMDSTINPNSTLASFSAEAALADNPPGRIIIAYSGNTLKELLQRFRQAERSKELDFSRLPNALLSRIYCPASAELGETSLTTNDISRFEVGDVVSLDTTISTPVQLTVSQDLQIMCQAGIKNKKASIKLLGLKDTGEIELTPPELAPEKVEPKTTLLPPKPAAVKPAPAPAAIPKPAQHAPGPAPKPVAAPEPPPPAKPAVKPAPPPPAKPKSPEEAFPDIDFGDDLIDEDFEEEDDILLDEMPEDKFPEDDL